MLVTGGGLRWRGTSGEQPGEDAMTGDTDKYLRPQDLKELGDDSLPQEGYMGFSIGARSASSDRSNTLNRSSFARDSMVIEEILAPTKDQKLQGASKDLSFVVDPPNKHLAVSREYETDSVRRYSWAAEALENVNLVSSPVHSGFLVSFMVDARGGSMRGSRHNGMRIIIPPRKCTAPTRITCRLAKKHKLAYLPPMVEGEGLASRLVEVGPAGAQFLGPVIVEIPHFGSLRGKERELIILRSENGETWKEHQYDCKAEDLSKLLNGMDEELDSIDELDKKRICRIVTRDFPQYFAVVSRIKQESNHIGPEGGVLSSITVPMVQASFPPGALTKRIRVGLQAQPIPDEMVKNILGNRAAFSPIVTVEPRRRKFHKPITMTIPVPSASKLRSSQFDKGGSTPCLRLLCSITGGTSPAQWEDITGTTPLSMVTDSVSFTTNVSARFWLADCLQISETVSLASQLYKELICVPYLAKFVVFAKVNDPMESHLRCFCMTDDKIDKTLEQQENFEEVARSKDIEVLEGKPIYVDCYGNLSPVAKTGQQLVFNFYAFRENRLPFCVKVRDNSQEPYGRLSFLKVAKTSKGLPQAAICNLNFTLPAPKKEMESEQDDETEKPERRHTFASLALRKRYSYLAEPAISPHSPCERTDLRMAIVADQLGLSWTELAREMDFSVDEINNIRLDNPNSLAAQSFMLLKKWVCRDGKNATTDALTSVLTKVNRMDIVTLLEGPIFDYGNITGTRSFADESAVFLDQANGYHSNEMELQSSMQLSYEHIPLWNDDFNSDQLSIDSSSKKERRCDSLLKESCSSAADEKPPAAITEDICPDGTEAKGEDRSPREEDLNLSHKSISPSVLRDFATVIKEQGLLFDQWQNEDDTLAGESLEGDADFAPRAWAFAVGEGCESGSVEEEEEVTEKLKSCLEDKNCLEDTEESSNGWHSGSSDSNMEPPTSESSLNSEMTNQHKNRQTGNKQSCKHTEITPVMQKLINEVTRPNERVEPGCEKAATESKFKIQQEEESILNKRDGSPGDKKIYS